MADQEINTSIDSLVAYLKEHGETNVTTVAGALGVTESVILGWANVLEKANFIKIVYKSGRAYLSPVSGAGGAAEVPGAKQADQSRLEAGIAADITSLDHLSLRIDEFNKSFAKVDELFKTKYKNVGTSLDQLNKLESYIESVEGKMDARTKHLKEMADNAQKDFETAQSYLTKLSGFSVDTNNARAISQELHDQLKAYEKNNEELVKNMEAMTNQHRKVAIDLSKTIKEKRGELADILGFEDKQLKDYERMAADYSRKSSEMVRNTNAISKQTLDELSKGRDEVEKFSKSMIAVIADIKAKAVDIKKDLGGLADFNAGVVGMKKDLADMTKQRDSLLAELKKMQDDARTLGSRTSQTTPEKMAARSESASESLESLKGKVDKMSSDVKSLENGKDDTNG